MQGAKGQQPVFLLSLLLLLLVFFCVVETGGNGMALFASWLLEDAPAHSLRDLWIQRSTVRHLRRAWRLALGDTRARSVRCLCRLTALNNGALCDVRRVNPVCVAHGIAPLRRRTQRRHHQFPHEPRAAVPAHPLHAHVVRAATSCTAARSLLKKDFNTLQSRAVLSQVGSGGRAALEAVGVVHEHNFGNESKGYTSIRIW